MRKSDNSPIPMASTETRSNGFLLWGNSCVKIRKPQWIHIEIKIIKEDKK
jgi:hypothetical protein